MSPALASDTVEDVLGAGAADAGGDEEDPLASDTPGVFPTGAFVLVGCGAAKRDPEDPTDVREAVVGPDEELPAGATPSGTSIGETGPAWEARDLYTSSYFAAKRAFAEAATRWARNRDGWPWAILSAEHAVVRPGAPLVPYDRTVEDLGDDPTAESDRTSFPHKRRPDGRPLLTELDKWATMVAIGLQRWVTLFDEERAAIERGGGTLRRLLVLAGQDYVEPLRERGAFNGLGELREQHAGIDVEPTFLFEELDAAGIGEQMAWLSAAAERLDDRQDAGEQATLAGWP